MRKEFLVERQGRTFCLYAGLLNLAHEQGLRSIQTNLIQVPSEANRGVAIASATVTMECDGVVRVFTGIGDAAECNVAPAMRHCLIRMAETRSKARALRDAVNIGMAAFEELGEEDAHDGAPERGYATAASRPFRGERGGTNRPRAQSSGSLREEGRPARIVAPPSVAPTPLRDEGRARPEAVPTEPRDLVPRTEEQAEAVRKLCRRLNCEPDALIQERLEITGLADLTQAQAGDLIRALSAQANGRTVLT